MKTFKLVKSQPFIIEKDAKLASTLERDGFPLELNVALDYRARLRAKARAKRWNKIKS